MGTTGGGGGGDETNGTPAADLVGVGEVVDVTGSAAVEEVVSAPVGVSKPDASDVVEESEATVVVVPGELEVTAP